MRARTIPGSIRFGERPGFESRRFVRHLDVIAELDGARESRDASFSLSESHYFAVCFDMDGSAKATGDYPCGFCRTL